MRIQQVDGFGEGAKAHGAENKVSTLNDFRLPMRRNRDIESGSASSRMSGASPEMKSNETARPTEAENSKLNLGEVAADISSSVVATTLGLGAFALSMRFKLPVRVLSTMSVAGAAKASCRGTIASVTHEQRKPDAWMGDVCSGALDGIAGLSGAWAEKTAAPLVLSSIGKKYISEKCGTSALVTAGESVIRDNALVKIAYNSTRGVVGGAAGGAVWSAGSGLQGDSGLLANPNAAGALRYISGVGVGTIAGGVAGGALCGAGTTLLNLPEVRNRVGAATGSIASRVLNSELVQSMTSRFAPGLKGALAAERNRVTVDLYHLNDFHSNLYGDRGIARVSTRLADLRANSGREGRSGLLFSLGDESSGNAVAGYSYGGLVENQALERLKPTAVIPGNHSSEIGRGKKDIPFWLNYMQSLDLGKRLAANVDVVVPESTEMTSKLSSKFKSVFEPYSTVEIKTPDGKTEELGLIGLVTDEIQSGSEKLSKLHSERMSRGIHSSDTEFGAQAADIAKDVKIGFSYEDHLHAARESVKQLRSKGVNKIIVLSHLGMSEDTRLAREVDGISAIIGGHSHDFTAAPEWVRNAITGREVPVVQAGSSGRWLGQLKLTFAEGGAADRYRTKATLHTISSEIPEDPHMVELLRDATTSPALDLMTSSTGISAKGALSIRDVRLKETELANLISDALRAETDLALRGRGMAPTDMFLKHSGDIRSGITPESSTLSQYDLDNIFCNGDNTNELCVVEMTGREIKNALEFGIADFESGMSNVDPSGNFIQVSGIRYGFDLAKPPGARLSEVMVEQNGGYSLLDDQETYRVLTLEHPLQKWTEKGVVSEATARTSNTLGLSQPRLLESYLHRRGGVFAGKNDPFAKVDGRIADSTVLPCGPGIPASGASILGCAAAQTQSLSQR